MAWRMTKRTREALKRSDLPFLEDRFITKVLAEKHGIPYRKAVELVREFFISAMFHVEAGYCVRIRKLGYFYPTPKVNYNTRQSKTSEETFCGRIYPGLWISPGLGAFHTVGRKLRTKNAIRQYIWNLIEAKREEAKKSLDNSRKINIIDLE